MAAAVDLVGNLKNVLEKISKVVQKFGARHLAESGDAGDTADLQKKLEDLQKVLANNFDEKNYADAAKLQPKINFTRSQLFDLRNGQPVPTAALGSPKPRVVAVSKTKPTWMIKELYEGGHHNFGENYVQELVAKAKELPDDINWHFIGHLQSNKAKQVVAIPNLYVVETVDSMKLANKLNTECEKIDREKLNVFVQVNTSGEQSKSGVEDSTECVSLVNHVITNCPRLCFKGLMTIGRLDHSPKTDCYERLLDCQSAVRAEIPELNSEDFDFDMSMGMSNDFELAVEMGATNVRIGSTIFGARDKVKPKTEDLLEKKKDES